MTKYEPYEMVDEPYPIGCNNRKFYILKVSILKQIRFRKRVVTDLEKMNELRERVILKKERIPEVA